jgi:YgiT-type zinc finger domain-containing protein
MRCTVCRVGETQAGKTTVTLERGNTTVVFRGVPAQVCANCGEAYVGEAVTRQLLQTADEAARSGVQVDIREFVVAPV